jgi:outer membrane protein OmpA-like peptidoglycan-associated protein
MNKNALYGFLFGGLSLLPCLNVKSQDVFGCDYVRQLKVNCGKIPEIKKSNLDNIINLSKPLEGESQNSLDEITMNIYFRNNEFCLSGKDSSDLNLYCKNILKPYIEKNKIKILTIEAHTDCIGSEESNLKLSDNRGMSIVNFLRRKFNYTDFYISSFGKSKSTETNDSILLSRDRVVKIIPDENPLKRALDVCKADIYLVDQSGSMKHNGEWQLLQKYTFPDSSRVYSFSKLTLPPNSKLEDLNPENFPEFFHTYDISTEVAMGKTAYYPASEKVIMSNENNAITAIVNGENNYGQKSHEEIINLALERNIKLNQVGINLSEESKKKFIEIAKKTGGKFYFFRKI